MKKLFALLLALAMVMSVLAGCGGGSTNTTGSADSTQGSADATGESGGQVSADGPKYGGHLNVRISSRPTGIDPLKQTGAFRYLYTTAIFETALTRDDDNNIVPGVCDFTLSEDLLDLKLWVRDGFVFSGGYGQVDIYDVEASINRSLKLYSAITKYVKPYIASMTVETRP